MILETYCRNVFGVWSSIGMTECSPAMFRDFIRRDKATPRLNIQEVTQDGDLVTVTRGIRLTGIPTERNECLFDSVEAASDFAASIRTLMTLDI